VKDESTEKPSTTVSATTKQVEDVRFRWSWAEPSVWTERMLTALEQGVKGGKWYALMDKVYATANLKSAFAKVKANDGAAGVDHVTVREFDRRWEANLDYLQGQLRDGSYRPQAVRRTWIPKPGSREMRPLGIPTVRDRTAQGALRNVLEPIFEHDFAEHSYGFRPGRGCKDALRQVDSLLKQGYTWVVDADLKSYFDTIPHDRLLDRLKTKISDGRVLELIQSYLKAGILEEMRHWTPESGAPQGAVLSPLLSNVYLDPLDQLAKARGLEMVRYADDFVILCRTKEEAEAALELVRVWVEAAGLTLHPEKTRIVDERTESFDFLGYKFLSGNRFIRTKSLDKFKDSIREKTARNSGHGLEQIIANVNPTLRGWFEYFKHADPLKFSSLDSWLRGRLRSILRRRMGGRGRGRGTDHQRWKNAYFAERGLFSLHTARAAVDQPF
jgi:RNA-directed DNA polymerase